MPSSLLSRATETDALIVCINGVVLAMNLMLLPLTLQVASSGTSIFLAMLLLGIALDKVYVLLSLVSTLPLDGYYEPRWLYRASDNDLFDGSRFSESC